MKKILLMFLVLITCTGCWNYTELNELGIVTALAISKKEDKFLIDLQMVNIIEGGDIGISESPTTIISGEGKTIIEAIRKLNLESSKVFFAPNVEYVIIDESVIKNDLEEVLDYLARDTKLPLTFLVVTAIDNEPKDILSALSQFNNNSASNITEVIKLSEERYGASYSLTFMEYLNNYLSPGITSVYPNIYIKEEEKKDSDIDILKESNSDTYTELKSLVTFDKDGNVIELNDEESFGYNFLKNHITNASITASCGNEYFTIETLKSKIGFEDKLKKDKLKVSGEIEGEIVFYGCEENLNSKKTLDYISKQIEEQVTNYIEKSIKLAQDKKTDFIGIGNWIYKNNYEYFDFEKNDWDSEGLGNLNFDYDIKVTLYKQGNLKGDV